MILRTCEGRMSYKIIVEIGEKSWKRLLKSADRHEFISTISNSFSMVIFLKRIIFINFRDSCQKLKNFKHVFLTTVFLVLARN